MAATDEYERTLTSASADVASFDERHRGALDRIQHALHANPALTPLLVLLASLVVFGVLVGSKFFSPFALTLILQQVQIVGILAAAQSLIILTAGIDLSVGAIAVACSMTMGHLAISSGLPAPVAVGAGLALGTALGAVSGALVAFVRLPPFIVTLGMWQIVLAGNYIYSANETVRSQDIAAQAPLLQLFGTKLRVALFDWGTATFTLGVLFMVALVVGLAYALRHTAWGRHVYAVGDDPEAAQLAGVDEKRTLLSVYMLAGLICALAGWIMIGRYGSASPSASTGQIGNIQAITAVVIGGISLFGGRGSILGAFFGALIVGVFELGLRMYGADPQWTYLLIGVLIIAAVTVDQWIRKVSA